MGDHSKRDKRLQHVIEAVEQPPETGASVLPLCWCGMPAKYEVNLCSGVQQAGTQEPFALQCQRFKLIGELQEARLDLQVILFRGHRMTAGRFLPVREHKPHGGITAQLCTLWGQTLQSDAPRAFMRAAGTVHTAASKMCR